MVRRCLIIDNEDQIDNFDTIIREGQQKNVKIECFQFNVGSPFRQDLLSEGMIDIQKVIAVIKSEFKGMSFDIIAFDWDYEDDFIDGVELIRQFKHHKIFPKTPKMLYSGLLMERVRGYVDNYANPDNKNNFNDLWKKLFPLISLEIVNFVLRDAYEKEIAAFLSKTHFDLNKLIIDELIKYPDLRFEDVHPRFKGMPLSEIIDLIETDPSLGDLFFKEIVERCIANMIELN
jgi:hypothetical protein